MFTWTEESAAFWADSAAYTKSYDLLAEKAAAHLTSGCTLFEGGCGLGHLSLALAKRGYAVTAMDLSPLPLRYLQASAEREGVSLTVRQGDAFNLPPGEVYDSGVFCFFGGVEEVLRWARAHCRDKLILFKKDWSTHRFTRDPGAIRKYTYPLTCEELKRTESLEEETVNVADGVLCQSFSAAIRPGEDAADFVMTIPMMFSRFIEKGRITDGLVPRDSAIFGKYRGDCVDGSISHTEIVDFMVRDKKRDKIFAFYSALCEELANAGL